jgi:phosphatidylserine/phosphatidylglycerophosphate/cardiolipin synthase-like enzyme
VKLFEADSTRSSYSPSLDNFVVSPANSRKVLANFLKSATKELLIYDPDISDKEMLRILQERSKAGVEVKIIGRVSKKNSFQVGRLTRMRLHTRTIINDRQRGFVGSQSLRPAELDSRRELGLIVRDRKVLKGLIETFEADWAPIASAFEQGDEPAVRRDAAPDERAVQVIEKELEPLAIKVKKVVKKAMEEVGEEALEDSEVKGTVKKVIKKVVKESIDEVVHEV